MLVVSLVILVFLLHVRSALIPILTLPVGVALAFVPMLYQGLNANIMSLGGIAVAIGAMVDAAIIMVENVHKQLEAWEAAGRPGERADVILHAMQEVGPSIFFALLVITVSFLPIFALEGTEGRLFKPLAFTKTYAMGFAARALGHAHAGARGAADPRPDPRRARQPAQPLARRAATRRSCASWCAGGCSWSPVRCVLLATAVPRVPLARLGVHAAAQRGHAALHADRAAGHLDRRGARILQLMDRELREVPEVERVFGKIGRAETPTDPAPLSMVETVVQLAPREKWRPGLTWDGARRRSWIRSSATRACRTCGGCRSRRAPRCSPPACAASSA